MRDASIDLSRLNTAERSTLRLLAQGHTAKSIATITDRSVASVNERLREARRKTGVGSSRELARLFAAQENRDDLFGVADAAPGAPSIDPQAASGGRSRKGLIMGMIALVGGAAALALFVSGAPQESGKEAISLIGTPFGSAASDASALNARFLAEKRDDAWASATERALDTRIAPIPNIGPIKVKCAATLCQVAGWIGPGDESQINAAMQMLQGNALRAETLKLGLDDGNIWFASNVSDPGKSTFVIFWKRTRG
ncbi:MAG: helix-turn-helix transcriptional regulator [Pseudomonadota bacterium]